MHRINIKNWKKISNTSDIYDISLDLKSKLLALLVFGGIMYYICMLFYEIKVLALISCIFAFPILKLYEKNYVTKVKQEIEDEFIDLNRLITAEMEASVPIEGALKNIEKRLKQDEIFQFKHINKELKLWINKLEMGLKLDEILQDFALRSEDESIKEYSKMVSLSTSKGSKLFEVISGTNRVLQERRDLKRELDILIAEKKLEQKLMVLMPILLVAMLKNMAPEFVAPLYGSAAGRITMTIVIGIFAVSYIWSAKMAELK